MRYKGIIAAVSASAVLLMCSCSTEEKITTASCEDFRQTMQRYVFTDENFITSDSEDGCSVVALADDGWLAGFYECGSSDIAYSEFETECQAAGIEDIVSGKGGIEIGKRSTDDEFYYYVTVDKTCLFMVGTPDDKSEMMKVASELGYTK